MNDAAQLDWDEKHYLLALITATEGSETNYQSIVLFMKGKSRAEIGTDVIKKKKN